MEHEHPLIRIGPADWSRPDFLELLQFHVDAARKQSATHAFGHDRLRQPDIELFDARDDNEQLLGFAGLKRLSGDHAEIKSVRTHPDHLRKGVSRALMHHLERYATETGVDRLSLETHPTPDYAAARGLYERLGYTYCEAFGDYADTELSVFMTKRLSETA